MSMMMDQTPRKKSKIPYIFVAFFGVVFTVNIAFVFFALSSWTGLETKNHYLKGLDYNNALEAAAAQEARGWESSMRWQQLDGLKISLAFDLKDKSGKAIAGADFRVLLLRPTTTGYDLETTLVENTDGVYQAVITLPLAGIWDVKQVIQHSDGTYQAVERITLNK